LGTQLAGMAADTASEPTRALAAEAKIASDLATESTRAVAVESKISADLSAEVSALERSQRIEADDNFAQGRVQDLTQEDVNLRNNIDNQGVIITTLNQDLTTRINGLDYSTSSAIGSLNNTVGDISMNRLPGLGMDIANETARAQQIENDLQQQISSLLQNTDATALNSLAELVADYSQNGSGITAALQAVVDRINQLEQTVAALQNTGGGYGSGTPPVEN
jgi:hypothetical protein